MNLPFVPSTYSARAEQERNRVLKQTDQQNHKRNRDVEIGNGRLILTAPDGGRWSVTVDDAGNLTTTSI